MWLGRSRAPGRFFRVLPSTPMSEAQSPSTALATRCVHGAERHPDFGNPVALPLVRSATFRLDETAYRAIAEGREEEVWLYGRYRSPTVEAVERRLASIEGAERALLFASGSAALHAALAAGLRQGDRIVADRHIYGGTAALLRELLPRMGVKTAFVDFSDLDALGKALEPRTRFVVCESLTNPLLRVRDVPAIAERAHARGADLLVDATFVTPVLQRPLELGADLVVHSATKFLGGHSDLIGGLVCGSSERLAAIERWRRLGGAIADPEAAWLLARGLATLPLRVQAACEGARRLARALAEHRKVRAVHHPHLAEPQQRDLAARLLGAPGALVAFEHAEGDAAAQRAVARLAVAIDAPSLGGVETLVCLPAYTSHAGLAPVEREALGLRKGLVRVSVGVEDPEDLVRDFTRALDG